MTYDKALDILIPAYNDLHRSTFNIDEIESYLVIILKRNGFNSVQANRYVKKFLDD